MTTGHIPPRGFTGTTITRAGQAVALYASPSPAGWCLFDLDGRAYAIGYKTLDAAGAAIGVTWEPWLLEAERAHIAVERRASAPTGHADNPQGEASRKEAP